MSNEFHNQVDRYVNGQMGESEAADFEISYLDHPERAEQVELAQLLKHGLGQVRHEPGGGRSLSVPWWRRHFSFAGSSGWIAAFATMTLVVMAQSVYFYQRVEQLSEPQANTPVLLLSPTRGNDSSGVVYLSEDIRWFALELELDWPDADWYSLLVSPAGSSEPISEVHRLAVSDNDTVVVSLAADSFADGDYDLAVSDTSGQVARFRMKVVRRKMH